MYSRSYKDGTVSLPEGYSGTAFTEPPQDTPVEAHTEPVSDIGETPTAEEAVSTGAFGSSQRGLPLGGLLSGLFGGTGLHLPKIGSEEILILAAAAFLFFSEGGDRECALMLLLLLFI